MRRSRKYLRSAKSAAVSETSEKFFRHARGSHPSTPEKINPSHPSPPAAELFIHRGKKCGKADVTSPRQVATRAFPSNVTFRHQFFFGRRVQSFHACGMVVVSEDRVEGWRGAEWSVE